MPTLNRYLSSDLVRPTIVTLGVLLSLVWLMQALRFLDFIINKGLGIGTFLQLTGYLLPSLLIVILPFAYLVGYAFSLKRLCDDNELAPIYCAGLSPWRILKPTMHIALATVAFGYLLTLFLIPTGMTAFKELQHELRHEKGTMLLEEGTFNQLDSDVMVYLKRRIGNTGLEHLLVHDTRNADRPVTWMAERGELLTGPDGFPQLKLTRGIRQSKDNQQTFLLEFQEHTLDVLQKIDGPEQHWRDAEERYLHELTHLDNLSDKQINRFYAEMHKRLLWPLAPIPLTLIAAVFLLKGENRRHLGNNSLWVTIGAGLLYVLTMMLLHNVASSGTKEVLLGQWAWPAVVSLLCIWQLNKRANNIS